MDQDITYQAIADRAAELDRQAWDTYQATKAAIDARVGAERRALRELCGGKGHVFVRQHAALGGLDGLRACAFCGASEELNASASAP